MKQEINPMYEAVWQPPKFYQLYYRRMVFLCIILSILGLILTGIIVVNYINEYVKYPKEYYVSTVDGRIIKVMDVAKENMILGQQNGK